MKRNCKRSCKVCGGKLRKLHLEMCPPECHACAFKLISFLSQETDYMIHFPLGLDCSRGNDLRFIVCTETYIVCRERFIV